MFKKILIANRGEIACRIIKTSKSMGIETVAVYSDADRDALHVKMADQSIYIGPSPASESYLAIDKLIAAALESGAEAIHPGYGFLSENADFCRQCAEHTIAFIGPPLKAIMSMGSKSAAKRIMAKAGVPLIPGYHGDNQDPKTLKKEADSLGYPVLLKAAAGGGGKGMRAVQTEADFDQALEAAKREAISSFDDDIMLVEKLVLQPRHVEIQVFCDSHQNAVYLFERDCSLQRRHQKVIEEAPAPGMTEKLRQKMGVAAIKAAQAIRYEGAGTVEFLLDSRGEFFFMEMNTRLQVEHPVTEMITGQDLVAWQLSVAAGDPLPCSQEELSITGHAFEARIYAEDPTHDFLPATGTLEVINPPAENNYVRIDTGVLEGDKVSIYYDPMIAKLIVWGKDRAQALNRLTDALAEYHITGVTTNIGFLYNLATSSAFRASAVDTSFIEQNHNEIFRLRDADIEYAAPLAASAVMNLRQSDALNASQRSSDPNSPWHLTTSWGLPKPMLRLKIQQCERYLAANDLNNLSSSTLVVKDEGFDLFTPEGYFNCSEIKPDLGTDDQNPDNASLKAPMHGSVVDLLVGVGDMVKKGDTLVIMEAMKMEHTIVAPADGAVSEFFFEKGDLVESDAELLAFEANDL
jgi:3-methylcrotonyl-CoA carboxylase alpha subunit